MIDSPLPEPLSRDVAFIPCRAHNVRILPVFGPATLAVSPRIGRIDVTLDEAPWHWADASGNPLIINGLAPGPRKILIQLVNANHQSLDRSEIRFTIPGPVSTPEDY
jgi:hypothetical protein